jgi:hypothetical protein
MMLPGSVEDVGLTAFALVLQVSQRGVFFLLLQGAAVKEAGKPRRRGKLSLDPEIQDLAHFG